MAHQQPETYTKVTMILIFILVLSASIICGAFTPKDHYLLYCGPPSDSATSFDGRVWSHDENSTFSSRSSFSSTITALADPDLIVGNPFKGARIFKSNFTYTFPVSPGPKFLRLFFYPAVYSQHDASQFFISVQANSYVLLRNFSAQLAVNYAPFTVQLKTTQEKYVMKEYYVSVGSNESSLDLTFSPTLPDSYAFVSGIELVSVPDSLYVTDNPIENVEFPTDQIPFSNSTALETAYRLNVGGSDVGVQDDGEISGIYRLWKTDEPYTFQFRGIPGVTHHTISYTAQVPNYTAPEQVYQTFKHLGDNYGDNEKHNLTWRFKVDPDFNYMVRLHWCEVQFDITEVDLIFEVYINNLTAENLMAVMGFTNNQKYVPFYKDYGVTNVNGADGRASKVDLWIALHPSPKSPYTDVLLNGLEIFKISKYDGGLDGPNPDVPLENVPSQQSQIIEPQKRSRILLAIIGGSVAGVFLVTLLVCLIFRRSKAKKQSSTYGISTSKSTWFVPSFQSGYKATSSDRGSALPSHLCRQFSLAHIRQATNDFSDDLIIGHGGFGNVYKGMVDGEKGIAAVAIKRLNASSKQGLREFVTEIQMLSKLRHIHLVSLIGFCDESGEMILVYEYMDRGTLRDHLYNTDKPPLSWNRRVSACLGAAKGLHYLHCGASQMIIHRDVKSTNILLDENWDAKVSDFGLSKLGPMNQELSHVSTAVKGSIGYLDLEYYKTQRLTDKSDVYSFGVVLFEVLCGRAAVDVSLSKEQVNLAKWARNHQRAGTLESIVDPNIKDEITPACLRKFGEIAESCVRDRGSDRPSMADVVWSLEFVLGIQEKTENFPNSDINVLPSTPTTVDAAATTSSTPTNDTNFSSFSVERMIRANSSSSLLLTSSEDFGESNQSISGVVFSEIFKPEGR